MQSEKSGEGLGTDNGSALEQVRGVLPHPGQSAQDRHDDLYTPVGILIEAHGLPGKGHPNGCQEERTAHHPGEFPGILVGAKEKDLHHVNGHQGDHKI